jgi:hypothetical protein
MEFPMSIVAFGTAGITRAAALVAARKRTSFFARLFASMMEARQKQAFNELRRHTILLPHELEQAGWKINERSEDSLPFLR